MKCEKCEKDFPESEVQESHDIPKYMGGTDSDGRHNLCKDCHALYELEIIKVSFMNMFKHFPHEAKVTGKFSARIVNKYFFKEEEESNDRS